MLGCYLATGGGVLFKKVTIFATALSVLALLNHATSSGFGAALELVLQQYESLKVLVLSVLQVDHLVAGLVKFFSQVLSISIVVDPVWSDIFVVLALYLMARMSAYWGAGMRNRAIFRLLWSFMVSLLTSVLAAAAGSLDLAGNVWIVISVVFGLAIFDVVDAAWSATFHRKSGLTWGQDWRRYAEFGMPTVAIGMALVAVFYISYSFWSADWVQVPGLLVLLFYSILLAVYWLIRGLQSSKGWSRPGTGYEKFRASSNTAIGVSMLQSLASACFIWAIDAGLTLLGSNTLAGH